MNRRYDTERWFTCSTVKPPCDGEYIVTCRGAIKATVLTYEEGVWYNDNRDTFDVVAWMFLPGAYRPDLSE